MTPKALLDNLAARDVLVTLAGEDLDVDAPKGVLTDGDISSLRASKAHVVRLLRLAEGLPVDDAATEMLECEAVSAVAVPVCEQCGRYCDRQTLAERWYCSRCTSDADARQERTLRLLRIAEQIRGRHK